MNKFKISPERFPILIFFAVLLVFASCKTDKPKHNWKYNDNTVRVRLAGEPDAINPLLSRLGNGRYVYERIFLPLLDYDPFTLKMTPVLAKGNPQSADITDGQYTGGMSYIYEIRDDAKWDDGKPVTGEDVDFTMKLLYVPGMPVAAYRSYYEFVKSVEVDAANPRRFTFIVDKKYMLSESALGQMVPLPAHIYDPEGILKNYSIEQLNTPDAEKIYGNNNDLKKLVAQFTSPKFSREKEGVSGSGPYALEKWETGQYVLLTKKKNWWGAASANANGLMAAYPDSLMYKIIPDPTATVTSIKDQEIDASAQIDSKDFVEMQGNPLVTENYNLHTPASAQIFLLFLNNKDPRLADKRVRQALAHLMDVDEFIKTLYDGLGERVTGPFDPWQDYVDKSLRPIAYNVEQAKTLLADAGWKDSNNNGTVDKNLDGKLTEMELSIHSAASSKASQNLSLFFQNSLQKAGIKAEIITKDSKEVLADVRAKKYLIYTGAMGIDMDIDDPKQQWHTENDNPSGSNYTGWGNATTDALIEEIRTTLDPAKRNDLYKKFQALLYDEQPAIFLFAPKDRIIIHKRFEGTTSLKRPGFFPNTFKRAE